MLSHGWSYVKSRRKFCVTYANEDKKMISRDRVRVYVSSGLAKD